MLELDDNIGRIMDAIRAEAPNTIVIVTADNGAWQDAWPDAGTTPFRGEKGSPFEGGWRVPGIMWWPGNIPAGAQYRRDDVAHRLLGNAGHDGRPHPAAARRMDRTTTASRSISTASITAPTLWARPSIRRATSWIYIDGESFGGVRADIGGDPENPDLNIAWKYLYTAKDTWLGPEQNLGAIGSTYNLTMDPFEKYDMTFNGAVSDAHADHFAGPLCRAMDNGWVFALILPRDGIRQIHRGLSEHQAFPGGASNDMARSSGSGKPVPLMDIHKVVKTIGAAD